MYLSTCLSIYLSIYLSVYLSNYLTYQPINLSIYLPIYLSTYLPIYLPTYLSTYLSIYLPIYLSIFLSFFFLSFSSVYLSVCLSIYLPVYLQAWKPNYAVRLLHFQSWQHQKWSNSARLPQCLNLTTSKTKQFCETSSFFKLDNIKNEAILRDFLQKWKVDCRADSLVPMPFAIFPVHLPKTIAPATKKWCQVIRSAAPVTQDHLSKPEDLRLQNVTPSQEMRARTSSQIWWTCLLYCACRGKGIFADPLQMSHACNGFWKCSKTLTFCSLLTRRTIPCACHTKRHLNVQTCPDPSCF